MTHIRVRPKASAECAEASAGYAISRQSVLLVEEEFMVLRTLAGLFEAAGFRVQARENGVAALAALTSSDEFALIVAGMDLPRMGGLELCREACTDGRWVPAILLTEWGDDPDVEELSGNVVGCLHKPLDIDRLVDVAGRALAGWGDIRV